MRLVRYTLCDIELAMVDIEGVLYCSTPQLESVFGVDQSNLSKLVRRYPEEFSRTTCELLTRYNVPSKEILDSLGLQRLRKNTLLWSEDDVIGITWLVRSDIARQCRAQFKEILRQHARRDYVPRDVFEEAKADFQAQLQPLKDAVNELMADKRKMASYAGRSLRLVRGEG